MAVTVTGQSGIEGVHAARIARDTRPTEGEGDDTPNAGSEMGWMGSTVGPRAVKMVDAENKELDG